MMRSAMKKIKQVKGIGHDQAGRRLRLIRVLRKTMQRGAWSRT